MPYQNQDNSVVADGQRQLGAELDRLVTNGTLTGQQALETAQNMGMATGPGAYQYPGEAQAETDALNTQSRQSAARSAAYQAERAAQGLGYDPASQDAFNSAHPLSDY